MYMITECELDIKKMEFSEYFIYISLIFANIIVIQQIHLTQTMDLVNSRFDLIGIAAHQGETTLGGHYWAYTKKDNVWYKCDDDTVRITNFNEIITTFRDTFTYANKVSPYLLFYQKRDNPLIIIGQTNTVLSDQKDDEWRQRAITDLKNNKKRKLLNFEAEIVQSIWSGDNLNDKTIVQKSKNLDVTILDLQTLDLNGHSEGWVNDAIINFYCQLIQTRNVQRRTDTGVEFTVPKVIIMDAFWYTKFLTSGATTLCRHTRANQTRKEIMPDYTSIFAMDKMIIPMYINKLHWTCCCINFGQKKIEYYDSLNWDTTVVCAHIKEYITAELKAKNGYDTELCKMEMEEWKFEPQSEYPKQINSKDCGVFTLKCIEWLSENMYIDYTYKDMTYFRKRILCDIVTHSIS